MSFQVCPKCKGLGSVGIGFPKGECCDVCGGCGIINEQTGLPPERKTEWKNYNFLTDE